MVDVFRRFRETDDNTIRSNDFLNSSFMYIYRINGVTSHKTANL